MKTPDISSLLRIGGVLFFITLSASFLLDTWRMPYEINDVVAVDVTFSEPVTVRLSPSEIFRTDGDDSMFSCYDCHEEDEPPEIRYDDEGILIHGEHQYDFELHHGEHNRNNYCFTCHFKENLERLNKPDGTILGIEEGNLLCGSCHGTLYRDWEDNLHGRLSGYWDTSLGPNKREDCTSCHSPHNPAFPSLIPLPGPQSLRPSTNGITHVIEEN